MPSGHAGLLRIGALGVLVEREVTSWNVEGPEAILGWGLSVALVRLDGQAGWIGVWGRASGKKMDVSGDSGSEPKGLLMFKVGGAGTRGFGIAAASARKEIKGTAEVRILAAPERKKCEHSSRTRNENSFVYQQETNLDGGTLSLFVWPSMSKDDHRNRGNGIPRFTYGLEIS